MRFSRANVESGSFIESRIIRPSDSSSPTPSNSAGSTKFTFTTSADGANHVVTVGPISGSPTNTYTFPVTADPQTFVFNGVAGDEIDTFGGPYAETVVIHPTSLGLTGSSAAGGGGTYQVTASGMNNIYGASNYSVMTGDAAHPMYIRAQGFDTQHAYGTGGGTSNLARLYDTPGSDTFSVTPDDASGPSTDFVTNVDFSGPGTHATDWKTTGFQIVYALHTASGSGTDTATFTHTSTAYQAIFHARSYQGLLANAGINAPNFFALASDFPEYYGYGLTAANDEALLGTSPNSPSGPGPGYTLDAYPDRADLTGTDVSYLAYGITKDVHVHAEGFKSYLAYRSVGDTAFDQATITETLGVDTLSGPSTDRLMTLSNGVTIELTYWPGQTPHGFDQITVIPPTPAVSLTSDTGSSSTDRITADGRLTPTGLRTGASVQYSIDSGSTWASTFSAVEGANSVQVRQTDADGNSSPASPAFTFTFDTTAPPAPALTASGASTTEIDLSWTDDSPNTTGYTIEWSPDETTWTPFSPAPALTDREYHDTSSSLTEGTIRYYRMKATGVLHDSDYSDDAVAQSLPAAPTDLHANVVSGHQIDLTWVGHSATAWGYAVDQLMQSGWEEIAETDPDATSISLPGPFDPSTNYTFRLLAGTGLSESAPSDASTVTTNAWPNTPTNLAANVVSGREIDLSWDCSAGAMEYHVWEQSEISPGLWIDDGTVTDDGTQSEMTFRATWLHPGGVHYSFRVAAVNDVGASAYAEVDDVQTVNVPPTVAEAATVPDTRVTGTSTSLSVLGADEDDEEENLSYTWSVASGGYVWFSGPGTTDDDINVNGTNAAKDMTATFTTAADYTLEVTITDRGGASVTSDVSVSVVQTLSNVDATPTIVVLLPGEAQQFTATAFDQFGDPMATQPEFTWFYGPDGGDPRNVGPGTLSPGGLYTAPGATDDSEILFAISTSAAAHSVNANIELLDPAKGPLWHPDMGTVEFQPGTGNAVTINSPLTATPAWVTSMPGLEQSLHGSFTVSGAWGSVTYDFPADFGDPNKTPALELTSANVVIVHLRGLFGTPYTGSLFSFEITRGVLEELKVSEHGNPDNQAIAIDLQPGELTVSQDDSGAGHVDLSAVFAPMTFGPDGSAGAVHITIPRPGDPTNPILDGTYDGLNATGALDNVVLETTPDAHTFVVTAWLDTDADGLCSFADHRVYVNVHVPAGWDVSRLGQARAVAAVGRGTVQQLATKIKLSANEYRRWLVPADGKGPPTSAYATIEGRSFTVPNTAYIDVSTYTWGPLATLLDLYRSSRQTEWVMEGLNVEYREGNVTVATIGTHLKSTSTYKYLFIGHGDEGGTLEVDADPLDPRVPPVNLVRPTANYTPYGIAELQVIACYSNDAAPVWRTYVSQAGRLRTIVGRGWFWTVVTGDYVDEPGTR